MVRFESSRSARPFEASAEDRRRHQGGGHDRAEQSEDDAEIGGADRRQDLDLADGDDRTDRLRVRERRT